jgi:hypothetical protein
MWRFPDGFLTALRLQPELDQAADGLGAIKFHALTRDPLVNCLQFIFGPLRIWLAARTLSAIPFATLTDAVILDRVVSFM